MAAPPLPPPPSGPALARWLHQLWTSVSRLRLEADGPTIATGTGAPTKSQPDGSLYLRTDGGTGTTLYVREAGVWTAK